MQHAPAGVLPHGRPRLWSCGIARVENAHQPLLGRLQARSGSAVRVSQISARSHSGGAATAAVRLNRALRAAGVNSTLSATCLDLPEPGTRPIGFWPTPAHARLRLALDQVPRWLGGHFGAEQFTTALGPAPYGVRRAFAGADVAHLHWIGKGTLPLRLLARIEQPMVWTLHDLWALTGGCHYDGGCGRFTNRCGCCPVLRSARANDLSYRLLEAKRRAYARARPTFVAPSRWMASLVQSSHSTKGCAVHVIPNAIDRTVFKPRDGAASRAALGLPQNAAVIGFAAMGGASEPRKGFDLLQAAVAAVNSAPGLRPLHLLVIGGPGQDGALIPTTGTGHLDSEDAVARALNAADVLVAPSRQDNLPNTVAEALACGVPTAAFDVGGLPDLIEHQRNGYLARPFDTPDLARGIAWVLQDPECHAALRAAARESTTRLAPERVAAQHIELYQEVLDRHRGAAAR